jgi:hypothetical protein
MFDIENAHQDKIDRMMFLIKMLQCGKEFYIGNKIVYFGAGGVICSKGKMVDYNFNRLIADYKIELREAVIS